jgi:putative ABC transport system permease protein
MRLHRWILALVSWLVPKDTRAEWRAEWEAEFRHREMVAAQWQQSRRANITFLREISGALADALWIQSARWHSLRLFGRHWRLALTALVSLGIAITAVVIGLSAVNALLFRPPGVTDPASLRLIHVRTTAEPFGSASFFEYTAYRDRGRAFTDIAVFPYSLTSVSVEVVGRKEQAVATAVSPNFFSVLGITTSQGRLSFGTSPAGDVDDVVINEGLWHRLGADERLLGATVQLNGQPARIAGVVPVTFRGMTWGFEPDVWMSLKAAERIFGSSPTLLTDPNTRWLHVVGRLAPGVSAAQAESDVQIVAAALAREHADTEKDRSAALTPVSVTPPGDRAWATTILSALMLVVTLTLVVACANVTNLLLGLAASRRHEMLVRAALGASRIQLVMPLVREAATLGVVAGLIGYGGAWLILGKLSLLRPAIGNLFPWPSIDLRPDWAVLVSTLAISLIAGVAVGLVPALRGASDGLSGAINRELAIEEPRKARVRHVLVVIQMAVATVVLVGVGVSIHSLVNMQRAPLGFSARTLEFFGFDLKRRGYDARTGPAFYDRLREKLTATSGIEAVTIASDGPLTGYQTSEVIADGDALPPNGHGLPTPYNVVDDRYFDAIGMKVLAGRAFDARDDRGRTEVVVINETLARRHWHGLDPIGRHLRIEPDHRLVEVIGVVPDGKYGDVDENQLPFMYFALAQHYQPDVTVIVRTSQPSDVVMRSLQDLEPNLVLSGLGILTLQDILGVSLLLPRVIVWTTIAFGLVAFGLAAIGLYSTVFYAVSQRRMEIGIRTALGATRGDLFALTLKQSGWVSLAGVVAGLAAGLALLPIASSIFYGIGRVEPAVLAGVALVSATITLGTTYLVVRPWTQVAALDLLRRR